MTLALSDDVKEARSTAVKATIDAGSTFGKIKLYTATRPASGASASGCTLLATILFSDPCGTVDGDGLHLTADDPAQAVAAGIINWARVTDSDDNYVMDGDVRLSTDTDVAIADFIIDVAQVYVGSYVNLVSALLAEAG